MPCEKRQIRSSTENSGRRIDEAKRCKANEQEGWATVEDERQKQGYCERIKLQREASQPSLHADQGGAARF